MNYDTETRYARQISLAEIGEVGQIKLNKARVLIIGAGGLGCPNALYLAAAGVGHIGIIDADRVSLSNLQRQILYETADIGRPKTAAAGDRLQELNPDITLELIPEALTASNAEALFARYDIIADGCDDVETRQCVNRHALKAKKPLVSAAIQGFQGQLAVFTPYSSATSPCYHCLYPEITDSSAMPDCNAAGILGAAAGVMGTLQAVEIINLITNIGAPLTHTLLRYDALNALTHHSKILKDPHCAVCNKAT